MLEIPINKKIKYSSEHITEMTITETKSIEETITDLILGSRRAENIQQKPLKRQLQQRDKTKITNHKKFEIHSWKS